MVKEGSSDYKKVRKRWFFKEPLNGSLWNQKWFFYGIAWRTFWSTFIFKSVGEKYAQIKNSLQAKTLQKDSKQICWCILMWEDNRRWTFSLEEKLLWTCILVRSDKNVLINLFLTNKQLFTSQDVNWWTGVVWIFVMFLSAVWTHSDGTHSLQRIHWWAGDVILNFTKSVPMKNEKMSTFSANFHFGGSIPLTVIK